MSLASSLVTTVLLAAAPPQSAAEVCPLKVSSAVPKVTLRASDSRSVELTDHVRGKTSVLVFYRGGWCPFCNLQLAQLRELKPKLDELGVQLVAISPDRPEKLADSVGKHHLDYTLLSDSEAKAIVAFGLAFRVPAADRERLKGMKMDIDDASGRQHHLLPVPAVYVVDAEGVVRFVYANPDYKSRLAPEVLLAAVQAVVNPKAPAR